MQRREFFQNFVTRTRDRVRPEAKEEPLSENELFIEAMRLGIDPATQSPQQLRQSVELKLKRESTPDCPSV
jgi:hypothetical protein